MTERKSTDDGEGRKPPATNDGQTRRTFLGAAAVLATLPTTAAAAPGKQEARARVDGDYGSSTVAENAYADLEVGAQSDVTLRLLRACDGVDLQIRTESLRFMLSLTPQQSRNLRAELRYAEAQLVEEPGTDAGGEN